MICRVAIAIVFSFAAHGVALEPAEVIVLVNKNVPASKEIADYYLKARGIPVDNVVTLDLPKEEDISRKDYDARLVAPLREVLTGRRDKIKCVVGMYGVPLRVGGEQPSEEERAELKTLDPELKSAKEAVAAAQAELKKLPASKAGATGEAVIRKERETEINGLTVTVTRLTLRRAVLMHAETQAAVDSELMLLWWGKYELRRWQPNLNYYQVPVKVRKGKPPVLLTARLDGPSPTIVKRMIDDAVAAEKAGLKGTVYVDARGIRFDTKGTDNGYGYGGYDESMREMAALLKGEGKMDVVLDDKNELFKPGSCPNCALYCGWYSHANFIDSCQFVPGAVAWHLASSEAVSLRRPDVKYWCKNQLEKGACATLGPVAEPYTVGFPKPAEFFGLLATGKYTLAECYGKTVLFASWMGTLIGDPLYNPFKNDPRLKEESVLPSPKGGKVFSGE